MSLRRWLTALLSSLGVLVPSATLPSGGYLGCPGTPPPAAAELSLPMAAPPAGAHIPPPPAPDPIWPIGVSNAEIYRLTERGLGLPYAGSSAPYLPLSSNRSFTCASAQS